MNTICNIHREGPGWLVEALTPDGMRLVIFNGGTRREALEEARRAEGEPA